MDPLKVPPPTDTKLHFLDYWRIIRIRKTVILAVFVLVVLTATLVTFILPPRFASTAKIRVDRDVSDITGLTERQSLAGYDPYFIETEFKVIQSSVILHKVIDKLNLNELWARKHGAEGKLKTDETAMLLKQQIDLRPVRNTSLIEIEVQSEDREEAASIANTIAEVYRDYRLEERRHRTLEAIKTLEDRWQEQEQKVRDAQKKVEELRTTLKVPDTFASENAPSPSLSAETLRRVEGLRLESKARYVEGDTLLSRLKKLSRTELRQTLPTAAPDVGLNSLLELLNMAEQKLITLKKDYGPEHAEVIKISAQVEDLNTKIDKRVDGILAGLEARVSSLKDGLDTLEKEVEQATQIDIKKAGESQPYFDAKQYLAQLQRLREVMAVKIAYEKIDVGLPKSAVVEIIEPAIPAFKPVRPNKPLNIALGIIVGLVVGVGLAFFIEYLDTSVKTIDDVERALQAPVLGVIPQNVGLILDEGAESPHAEAYRVLRTNLLFSRKDDKRNTVCVVSAGAGEGKTTTVFNLATVFAQSGQRVLIVDSDLRRPTLHKLFHVGNTAGLTSYLLRQNALEEVIQTTSISTLNFLPSGKLPSSSLGILSSAQMKALIGELKQRYDFIFFDSPPIMGVSDASILASEVDMTLQVIQYRRYPQPMNIRAKQLIEKVGGNLIGIVLNNINMSQDESYYYYSGYYHDYYTRNEEDGAARQGVGVGEKTT
jgi:capsular exopolysaccharide synthesis family protein